MDFGKRKKKMLRKSVGLVDHAARRVQGMTLVASDRQLLIGYRAVDEPLVGGVARDPDLLALVHVKVGQDARVRSVSMRLHVHRVRPHLDADRARDAGYIDVHPRANRMEGQEARRLASVSKRARAIERGCYQHRSVRKRRTSRHL